MSSYTSRKVRKLAPATSNGVTTLVKPPYSERPVHRATARARGPTLLNVLPLEVTVSKVLSPPPPPARPKKPEEAYIAVMGRSGAGKTSFINLASNSDLPVGEGLKSCTNKVELSQPFQLDGHQVRLIDTPGFDDSTKSDADVLNEIATFLATEFKQGRKIHGIIYFHRISDVRVGAISRRNLVMFQKLCGEHAFPNVVLATSRWSEVDPLVGQGRESELQSKAVFFKPIIDAGASLMRYDCTVASAHTIVRQLLERNSVVLSVQKEMVEEGKDVQETEAGKELQKEKLAEMRRYEESMKGLVQELEMLKKENDADGQKELEVDVQELKEKVKSLREDNRKLASLKNSREETPQMRDTAHASPPQEKARPYLPELVAVKPVTRDPEGTKMVGSFPTFSPPTPPANIPIKVVGTVPPTRREATKPSVEFFEEWEEGLKLPSAACGPTASGCSSERPSWGQWFMGYAEVYPSLFSAVSGIIYGVVGRVN